MKLLPFLIPGLGLADIWLFFSHPQLSPDTASKILSKMALDSHNGLTGTDPEKSPAATQPCALGHGHLTELRSVPPGDEKAVASWEFLERHQATAAKVRGWGACWLVLSPEDQLSSPGGREGRLSFYPWVGCFLSR